MCDKSRHSHNYPPLIQSTLNAGLFGSATGLSLPPKGGSPVGTTEVQYSYQSYSKVNDAPPQTQSYTIDLSNSGTVAPSSLKFKISADSQRAANAAEETLARMLGQDYHKSSADDEELTFNFLGSPVHTLEPDVSTTSRDLSSRTLPSSSARPASVSENGPSQLRFTISAEGKRAANAAEEILATMLGQEYKPGAADDEELVFSFAGSSKSAVQPLTSSGLTYGANLTPILPVVEHSFAPVAPSLFNHAPSDDESSSSLKFRISADSLKAANAAEEALARMLGEDYKPKNVEDEELTFTFGSKGGDTGVPSVDNQFLAGVSSPPPEDTLLKFKISAQGKKAANAAEEILARMLGSEFQAADEHEEELQFVIPGRSDYFPN